MRTKKAVKSPVCGSRYGKLNGYRIFVLCLLPTYYTRTTVVVVHSNLLKPSRGMGITADYFRRNTVPFSSTSISVWWSRRSLRFSG